MKPYYEHAGITIYHGDCRAALPTIEGIDHVLTDPPYDAMTHDGARRHATGVNSFSDGGAIRPIAMGFDPFDVDAQLPLLLAAASRWVVAFCSLEMLGDYKRVAGERWIRGGFWHRLNGAPQFTGDRPGQPGDGVAIMHAVGKKRWNGGGHTAFWETNVVKTGRQHPAEKPERLMEMLVSHFTDPGEVVCDPFMGSGTTLIAAKRLRRSAIGVELEEKYCEIAAKRLQQEALPLEVA